MTALERVALRLKPVKKFYGYKQKHVYGRKGNKLDEHRFIMEQAVGRRLGRNEYVHHINGDKRDNRLENLKIVTPKEHAIEHWQWKHPKKRNCVICGKEFAPTHRARDKTCSTKCRYILSGISLRKPHRAKQIKKN